MNAPPAEETILARWERYICAQAREMGGRRGASRDEMEDLAQEGRLVMLAVARTGETAATRYCQTRIRGAMQQWMRDRVPLITIPVHLQQTGVHSPVCYLASVLSGTEGHNGPAIDPLERGVDPTEAMLEVLALKALVAQAHLCRREQRCLAAVALGCDGTGFRRRRVLNYGAQRARAKLRAAQKELR